MDFGVWSPKASGDAALYEEMLLRYQRDRDRRVLVVPALFDEANKMRRFTLTLMRALDEAGIDCILPDLPGCNESLAALDQQTLDGWRTDLRALAQSAKATHVLTIRAGALLAPADMPGWQYAPVSGAKMLSGMLRAKVIADKENGHSVKREQLLEQGRKNGLTLAGWTLGPAMLRELETAHNVQEQQRIIEQADITGAGLWLRAEPGEDPQQAQTLASLIVDSIDTLQSEPAQ